MSESGPKLLRGETERMESRGVIFLLYFLFAIDLHVPTPCPYRSAEYHLHAKLNCDEVM